MSRLSIVLVVISTLLVPRSVSAGVEYDATIPQLKFVAQDIERALVETHYLDWNSTLNNGMKIQAAHFGVKRETKDITEKAYRKKKNTRQKKI